MKKIINSPWTVTIVGTTLGVLIAFVLNNWKETYQEKNKVDIVLEQIKLELAHNRDALQESYDSLEYIEPFYGVFKYFDDDTLLMSVTQKANYIKQYKNKSVVFLDSTLYENDRYSYEIDISGKINLKYNIVKLGDVSWRTAQSIGVIQAIPFEFLKGLEEVYSVQLVLKNREDNLLELLEKGIESYGVLKTILVNLHQTRKLQNQLILIYDEKLNEF